MITPIYVDLYQFQTARNRGSVICSQENWDYNDPIVAETAQWFTGLCNEWEDADIERRTAMMK